VPPLRPLAGLHPAQRQVACLHAQTLPPFAALGDSESLMSDRYRRRLTLLRDARLAWTANG